MVNIGNVWDRTTAFIGDHARAIVPIALLGILVPTTISNVVWGASQTCDGTIGTVVATIVTVVMTLVTLWAQLALTAMVVTPADNAGRAATHGFGRAIAAMLALLVVFAIAAAPMVLGMLAGGGTVVHGACDSDATMFNGHANPLLVLYGVVLILASAFVSVRLTLLYPVVVAEKLSVSAIARAFRLSRGIVWKLIGVWLLFAVVNGVASAGISFTFGAVFGLFAPNAGPFALTTILVAMLRAGVGTAFTLIVATFAAQLYLAATGADVSRPAT